MYVFVCMYIIECKYVTYYHWIVMSQFQQKPQLTLGSGEWLLHCRYGCVTNALSDSQTQWCSFMSKRTVTMWLAEDHIPKSRWLTRTLWVSSTSAAAVNAKGDGKDTMAPQGTDSCNKCLKYFIIAPFKGICTFQKLQFSSVLVREAVCIKILSFQPNSNFIFIYIALII